MTELLESGAYTKELLAQVSRAGLSMFEKDGRLLSYPSLVRLLPGDAALERTPTSWTAPTPS